MASALIDFPAGPDGRVVRRVYSDPVAVLSALRVDDVRALLDEVDVATRVRGLHAVGYLSYEAAPAFDRALRVRSGGRLPLAWFGLFRASDSFESRATTTGFELPAEWSIDLTRAEYDEAIAITRDAIAEGRTYQVNLTTRLRGAFSGSELDWYESLRRAQGGGYHAYLDLGDAAILSASPELFFTRRGSRLESRPMKGTRARGRYAQEDECRARELLESAKDRAENLMIVDLVRNDFGRIAETGTVAVPHLFQLEQYRTVWQLTSTVQARIPDSLGLTDVLAAFFPCGSVTGAPKISTMQMIEQLERSPREVYCGAIGVVEPGGDCTFNVPIRTVWIDRNRGQAEYGVGSGVTWDSLPSGEFEEMRAKSVILTEPWPRFELLETLRLESGEFVRLERHLHRLRTSARYFGFSFCEDAIRAQLRALSLQQPQPVTPDTPAHPQGAHACAPQGAPQSLRVRLLLSENGALHLETSLLQPLSAPFSYVLADHAVDSSDRFLFHKTTRRASYERALADHPGVFDVLLWNERGELTEFTRGNLVLELDGARLTPTLASGLLAGTFRAQLLEEGTIAEQLLTRGDLAHATRVWFINSVREWVELKPAGSSTA